MEQTIGKWLLVSIFVSVMGVAVFAAIEPMAQANAYATRVRADQQAAQSADRHEYWMEIKREVAPQVVWGINLVVMAAAGAVGIAVLCAGWSAGYAAVGVSRAGVEHARLMSRTIGIDAVARQFPLVIDNPGNPRFMVNPNTGEVYRLGVVREANRLMVAGSHYTQAMGVVTANDGRQSPMMLKVGDVER